MYTTRRWLCYKEDGEGLVSVKELLRNTGMLKSLLNRTINSLEEKGLLIKEKGTGDRRTLYVKCVKDKLDLFIRVHGGSLEVAEKIMNIIGEEDKQTRIIRTCLKGHNFGAFRFVVAYKRQLYKFLRAKNPSKFCTF
ncbi:MAG: MarR family transcriptional regulator [Clostridia bacterium]|nr:MarR family transcriptional regulator [Clostridia bacterium]